MVKLLRDLVAIPSESGEEGGVIRRIRQELAATRAFDSVRVDGMGNLHARIGRGKKLIAVDAHVDTVGIGERREWAHDPYKGKLTRTHFFGRGAGDQEGAVPAMIYAGRIIRDLGLISDDWSLLLTFTVMEEDCDGLCWQYIIREEKVRPDCVVVTDSTNCNIFRGHRGRMEIGVWTKGRSCHGSMPEKGDNALYKMARIVGEIEELNTRLKADDFLGKGTITATFMNCQTPSVCAVPSGAFVHLDRRLTVGETKTSALDEVKDAVRRAGVEATVKILRYSRPSYRNLVYETEKYFPTWCSAEDAPQIQAAVRTYNALNDRPPFVHRWTFSTNAVAIAGMFGIPCVGFGPAPEEVAHTVKDSVPIAQLVRCAAFYAAFPHHYCNPVDGAASKRLSRFRRR